MNGEAYEKSDEGIALEFPVAYRCGESLGSGIVANATVRHLIIRGDLFPGVGSQLQLMLFLSGLEPVYIRNAIVRWRFRSEIGVEVLQITKLGKECFRAYLAGVRSGQFDASQSDFPWEEGGHTAT